MQVNRLEATAGPFSAVADSDAQTGPAADMSGASLFAALLAMMMGALAPSQNGAQPSVQEALGVGTNLQPLAVPILQPQSVRESAGDPSAVCPQGVTPQRSVSVESFVAQAASQQASLSQMQMSPSEAPASYMFASQMSASIFRMPDTQTTVWPMPPSQMPSSQMPQLPADQVADSSPPVPPISPAGAPVALSAFAPRPLQRPEDQALVSPTKEIAAVARPIAPFRVTGPRGMPLVTPAGKAFAPSQPEPTLIPAAPIPQPLSVPLQVNAPESSLPIPSPVTPDQLMDLLARSVVASKPGRYTVTLQLAPEHLGEVRLQIHVAGKEVQTLIQAATPEARQSLQSGGEQLRQSLDQAGLNLAGFQVSTGGGGGAQDRQRQFQETMQYLDRRRGRPESAGGPGGPARVSLLGKAGRPAGGLDTIA